METATLKHSAFMRRLGQHPGFYSNKPVLDQVIEKCVCVCVQSIKLGAYLVHCMQITLCQSMYTYCTAEAQTG